ncbi:hypothetical protein Tco_1016513 [Tanacetum coccineum]|uniref:Copia protein n=1 Tax=Tanacetum coccineum TaxID=301880 RepID=A0ABQ5FQ37_9ASTR
MAIEESKDLTSLSLDELIVNLKVHEMIIKKDSEIVKSKIVERKSLASKAKKNLSDKCSNFRNEDEEYAMRGKRLQENSLKRSSDPNHLIGECPKPPKDKNQRAFVEGSWSNSGDEDDEKVKDETCLVAHASSEKQTALAISTTEAEYVSAGKACQQALWMKQALIDYDVRLDDVPIMCDNKGAIDLSKNPVQHSRTKHIKIRHHFLRDNVQKGHISIEKVPSVDNIADILTKPLKRESFNIYVLV